MINYISIKIKHLIKCILLLVLIRVLVWLSYSTASLLTVTAKNGDCTLALKKDARITREEEMEFGTDYEFPLLLEEALARL